ncbi:MAG: class I SAM-dependent methyltransferase [Actinomycetota bacterium]
MSDDPKEIVETGYDAIVERYAEWSASFESPAMSWVAMLLDKLEQGSNVLELGCGGGGPVTSALAESRRLHGVDISARQIERARERVPSATFECGDATRLEFESETFDAVASLFMLGHVPRAEQAPLLASIYFWLRPGGWFLATMGVGGADDEVDENWLGAPTFWASFDEATNRKMLTDAGFELQEATVIASEERGHGVVRFFWVLARRPE